MFELCEHTAYQFRKPIAVRCYANMNWAAAHKFTFEKLKLWPKFLLVLFPAFFSRFVQTNHIHTYHIRTQNTFFSHLAITFTFVDIIRIVVQTPRRMWNESEQRGNRNRMEKMKMKKKRRICEWFLMHGHDSSS